jgi:hypothetical protein
MKNMVKRAIRWSVLVATLGILVALLLPARVATQGAGQADQETKGVMAKARGADPNIKNESATNTVGKASGAVRPNAKTGEASRQATCNVRFDNRTDFYIQTFVDGRYAGQMGPWGDVYTWAVAGPTVLYARAVFVDGSTLSWGPITVSCLSSYTWRLTY